MKRVLVLLLLVGCSGPAATDTVDAQDAAEASRDAVDGRFDYLLFLGITGTEGPLNWTRYEAVLETASDPGSSIAEGFDQDVDSGEAGDGLLGSWLTTHFVYDEERRLLGGLYTQYAGGEVVGSVYAPFRGPYAGTPGLPALRPDTSLLAGLDAQEGNATLCGIVSSTGAWEIDSAKAAEIALDRSIMQAHIDAYPDGEFTYYYFPELDVEPGCPATLDASSNFWTISHVDLDEYLAGGVPTVAEVRIDARTGEVLAESVRPLYYRDPLEIERVITAKDPLVPATAARTHNASFVIDPFVQTLDIRVIRTEGPDLERSAETRLRDPTGRTWDRHEFDDAEHGYRVTSPTPGRWTVEYVHQSIQPDASHEVAVHAVAYYA